MSDHNDLGSGGKVSDSTFMYGDHADDLRGWIELMSHTPTDGDRTAETVWKSILGGFGWPAVRRVKVVGTNAEGDRVVFMLERGGRWVVGGPPPVAALTDWAFSLYPPNIHDN